MRGRGGRSTTSFIRSIHQQSRERSDSRLVRSSHLDTVISVWSKVCHMYMCVYRRMLVHINTLLLMYVDSGQSLFYYSQFLH